MQRIFVSARIGSPWETRPILRTESAAASFSCGELSADWMKFPPSKKKKPLSVETAIPVAIDDDGGGCDRKGEKF